MRERNMEPHLSDTRITSLSPVLTSSKQLLPVPSSIARSARKAAENLGKGRDFRAQQATASDAKYLNGFRQDSQVATAAEPSRAAVRPLLAVRLPNHCPAEAERGKNTRCPRVCMLTATRGALTAVRAAGCQRPGWRRRRAKDGSSR